MVRPEELQIANDIAAAQEAAAAEAIIDRNLKAKYAGVGRSIIIDAAMGVRSYIVDYVVEKYRRAGWTVKRVSDQRDGDFFEFTHIASTARDH